MKERSYGDFNDFRVGDEVKVISRFIDFTLFKIGEPGVVIKNSGKYLGIHVKFKNGLELGCNPEDLVLIEKDYNKTFIKLLTAFLCYKGLLKKEYGLKKVDKIEPKNICCACKECGQKDKDCVCEHNSWVDFIMENSR